MFPTMMAKARLAPQQRRRKKYQVDCPSSPLLHRRINFSLKFGEISQSRDESCLRFCRAEYAILSHKSIQTWKNPKDQHVCRIPILLTVPAMLPVEDHQISGIPALAQGLQQPLLHIGRTPGSGSGWQDCKGYRPGRRRLLAFVTAQKQTVLKILKRFRRISHMPVRTDAKISHGTTRHLANSAARSCSTVMIVIGNPAMKQDNI